MDQFNPLLVELTRVLAATAAHHPLPLRLCRAFAKILSADGGSVALGLDLQQRVVLCVTDETASRVEDAHEVLGEGPCLEVARTGTPLSGLTQTQQRSRWPMYFELLEQGGLSPHLHVFPLKPRSDVIGTVCVYKTEQSDLAVDASEAQHLANAIAVALSGEIHVGDITEERWMSRDRIDQATGMVIAQLRISPVDAMSVLRAHAFANATTLDVVSKWVLDRAVDFSNADSSDGEDQ